MAHFKHRSFIPFILLPFIYSHATYALDTKICFTPRDGDPATYVIRPGPGYCMYGVSGEAWVPADHEKGQQQDIKLHYIADLTKTCGWRKAQQYFIVYKLVNGAETAIAKFLWSHKPYLSFEIDIAQDPSGIISWDNEETMESIKCGGLVMTLGKQKS